MSDQAVDGKLWDDFYGQVSSIGAENPALQWRWAVALRLLDLEGAGARFCDIGCGDGGFSALVARVHPHVEIAGYDGSEVGVAKARERVPSGRFLRQDLIADPGEGLRPLLGFATHAICTEVLEHLDDPVGALRGMKAVFAPGGKLLITVPGGPMSASDRHFGHRKHYTAAILRGELTAAGYDVLSIRAAGFPFLTFYRLVVLLYGDRAVRAQLDGSEKSPSGATGLAFAMFRRLFRFNLPNFPIGGWQLFAIARPR